MNEEFLTVSELGNFVRDVLKSGFPRALWVCGEIQELREKNNHLYFTLSEKDTSTNQVVAKIGATIWANSRFKIESILKNTENAFVLKEDIQVKLLVKVDFYPPFGQIRLIVESIDPVYTLGKIAQDRQRLIALLKQKGILDQNKRVPLPDLMLRIGLITSYESAAYHDFVDELKRSGFGFKVLVADATMQGKNAQGSVAKAIGFFNNMGVDVIVITRGGGSVAELSCFDSAMIAEAVAQCRYPVISGIGHEINTTITDLAAHTYAKTPTAVAQLLIEKVKYAFDQLEDRKERLLRLTEEYFKQEQRHIKNLADAFLRTPVTRIKLSRERLRNQQERIIRLAQMYAREQQHMLAQQSEGLKKTIQLRLEKEKDRIKYYQKLVDMADPKNTLKRGFSITRSLAGDVIYSVEKAKKAQKLQTTFADGTVESSVI